MKTRLIILFILIITFVLGNYNKPKDSDLPDVKTIFPEKIGVWKGKDLTIQKNVLEFLDEKEIMLRLYEDEKTKKYISLAVVVTNKRDHIHDPEICYRGQGLYMESETKTKIGDDLEVNLVNAKKRGVPQKVIYWYTDLRKNYTERSEFMKDVIFSRFLNKPAKALILVVIIAPDNVDKSSLDNFTLTTSNALKEKL